MEEPPDIELPEDFTREKGHRTFVIIELAVRKAWRRRGIAAEPGAVRLRGMGTPQGRRVPPVGRGAAVRLPGPRAALGPVVAVQAGM
ncbi:hypothetical protein ABZ250_05460 [Streptomyces afghaniensis]|uniref:hypothetical protein n=1 Tax=Streptomyces afghaniensis TaxID=66865 RepID=UPI00339EDD8D